ncbi:MAG TPA: glycosyltransferase family A protein [Methylomirabilota bacterium]|nr:glycosyltransferase family A protein [Methylomirabilota bacterium]
MSVAGKPRVSIIIIFINERRFLAAAVASVFAQTTEDWELILADDGSTDGSTEIAADLVRQAPDRVRLLHHPKRENRGMSATRNLGLAAATGDYVGFLDADDIWVPEKLEAQLDRFERDPNLGLVYGRTLIWNNWGGGPAGPDFCYDLGVEPDRTYPPPVVFRVLLANKSQTPTTCNALMRRSLIDRIGGFEEDFRGMFEDQVFFAKALLAAPTHVSGNVWAKYRQHAASHSAQAERDGAVNEARVRFLTWLQRHARDAGASAEDLRLIGAELFAARRRTIGLRLRRLLGFEP